jgi:hypothetical protein
MARPAAIRDAVAVLLPAFTLAGCGLADPYQGHPAAPPAGAVTAPPARAASPRGEDGPRTTNSPPSGSEAVTSTAQAALERFAWLYVNWQMTQLPERARQLAALSVGQARAQAHALATRARTLERYQVTNSGAVTAIAPGRGQEQGRWAIVTNETTSGTGPYSGLPATSHVTWATIAHTRRGYVVNGWYPAS